MSDSIVNRNYSRNLCYLNWVILGIFVLSLLIRKMLKVVDNFWVLYFGYSFLYLLFICVNVFWVLGIRLFWEEYVFKDGVVSFIVIFCINI